ncbi:hypothetical protein SeLEV6574_g01237 [Synchytrium endobioticum]|uniref:Uncharacterized protein n=1 Tax=Synchytrium endobioticum TaxID=286115 RepID=A0A507DDT2_9FUNG|nr:hypothetical protein SeLEV6574_g01237 [Synchytrium endobioticum]
MNQLLQKSRTSSLIPSSHTKDRKIGVTPRSSRVEHAILWILWRMAGACMESAGPWILILRISVFQSNLIS